MAKANKKKGNKKDSGPVRDAKGRFVPSGKKSGKSARVSSTKSKAQKTVKQAVKKPLEESRVKIHETLPPAPESGKVNRPLIPPVPVISKTGQQPPKPPDPPRSTTGSTTDSGGHDPSRPIGPGNPPRSGQIQPGEVRNPKGYPKGRPNAKTVISYWLGVEEEIENPLQRGEWLKVTVLDVMTLGLIAQARKGNVVAYRELLDRIEGKPVQSTKLLNADDKLLELTIGFAAPKAPAAPVADKKEEGK